MSTDSTMRRLRRGNPVPPAPAAHDADLFARITALPSDSRLHVPAGRWLLTRPAAIVALGIALAALLASTAFAVSQLIGQDVVRPPVTRQEYLDAQEQLTLPPGAEWPTFNPGPSPESSLTSRGAGGGQAVLIAQNAWECYWVDAIRRGDEAAERQAQAALNDLLANHIREAPPGASENWAPTPLPTVPVAYFAHDGGLDWIRASYEQAADGDARNLTQSCRANARR